MVLGYYLLFFLLCFLFPFLFSFAFFLGFFPLFPTIPNDFGVPLISRVDVPGNVLSLPRNSLA